MLTVKYIQDHNLYMVIPVIDGKESGMEFMFSDFLDAKEFIEGYYLNPVAALFAYECRELHAA